MKPKFILWSKKIFELTSLSVVFVRGGGGTESIYTPRGYLITLK